MGMSRPVHVLQRSATVEVVVNVNDAGDAKLILRGCAARLRRRADQRDLLTDAYVERVGKHVAEDDRGRLAVREILDLARRHVRT